MQLSSITSLAKAITIPALQNFETHLDPNYRSMEVHLTRLSTSFTAPLMVEGVIFDYSNHEVQSSIDWVGLSTIYSETI